MPDKHIPGKARGFIKETFESVEQLEILLLLISNPEREWSAAEVGDRVRTSVEAASAKLNALHVAQLVALRQGGVALYRYQPSSSALAQEVADCLAQAYRDGKDTLIHLIYTRPFENIRYFADVLRIGKRDPGSSSA